MTTHELHSGHTLWLMRRQKVSKSTSANKKEDDHAGDAPEDWAKSLKKLATFHTVEDFWKVYSHVIRPNEATSTDIYLFREGIQPVWEDPANKRGGKFHLKVRKGLASRFWESLLLAVIGEQFGEYSNEICGVVVSMRNTEDVLSLWTRNYCGDPSSEVFQKIRDGFRLGLKIPAFIPIDYKKHDTHHQLAGPNEVPQLTAPPSVHVPPQTGALQQQQQQQQHLPAWKGNKEWRG